MTTGSLPAGPLAPLRNTMTFARLPSLSATTVSSSTGSLWSLEHSGFCARPATGPRAGALPSSLTLPVTCPYDADPTAADRATAERVDNHPLRFMALLRVRIDEGERFTVFDVAPPRCDRPFILGMTPVVDPRLGEDSTRNRGRGSVCGGASLVERRALFLTHVVGGFEGASSRDDAS